MSDKPQSPVIDDFLCFAIYSANNAMNRVYKPLLEEIGLTYTQYLAMVCLWEKDDQTVGDLGDKLFLESSTLTPMLKRLETLGYIRRQRDRDDERVVRIALTPEGSALREKARKIPAGILAATGLTTNELVDLKDQIGALRQTLSGE